MASAERQAQRAVRAVRRPAGATVEVKPSDCTVSEPAPHGGRRGGVAGRDAAQAGASASPIQVVQQRSLWVESSLGSPLVEPDLWSGCNLFGRNFLFPLPWVPVTI